MAARTVGFQTPTLALKWAQCPKGENWSQGGIFRLKDGSYAVTFWFRPAGGPITDGRLIAKSGVVLAAGVTNIQDFLRG